MTQEQEPGGVDRKKRVQRLKKIIVMSVLIGILVPWLLCVVLLFVTSQINRDLQGLSLRMLQLEKTLSDQVTTQQLQIERLENLLQEQEQRLTQVQTSQETLEELTQESSEEELILPQALHKVYLTFDDGPSSSTGQILDILKEYDVKATFFVLGKDSEADQELLKRIVEEGHSLGMHSYSHKYDEIYASREAFAEDFRKIQDYLYQVTGVKSQLYRFPGGSSNTIIDMDIHELIDYLEEQDTVYYDWNVSSGDAAKVLLTPERIVQNCLEGLSQRETSVVLLHDAAGRPTTVEALPALLEAIQGMEDTVLLPITDQTQWVQHVKAKEKQ